MKLAYIRRPTTIVMMTVMAMLAMARVMMVMVAINVATVLFSVRRDKDISNHKSNSCVSTTAKHLKGGRTLFDIISIISCLDFAHESCRTLTDFA